MDRQRIMVVGAAYMMEREMAMGRKREGGRGKKGLGGVVKHRARLMEGKSTFKDFIKNNF